jgi:hypothetical protein
MNFNEESEVIDLDQPNVSKSNENVSDKSKCWKWNHFEKHKNERIKCKKCDKTFSNRPSTDTLKYHQKTHEKVKSNSSIINFLQTTDSKKTFRDCLIDFIVDGQHPFSITEEPKFISMIKSLSSETHVPTRNTIKSDCESKLSELKLKVIECMKKVNSRVALTSDIWTSIANVPYISVTAHFLNEDKQVNRILLDFTNMPFPHKGEEIEEKVKGTIIEYNLSNKFIALTSDNATNNVKGIKLLQNWLTENNFSSIHHIRCLAHILNLSVKAGISVVKSELDDIRKLFSFIKISPKYSQLLQEKCQVLNIKYLKPKVDVETRWNSTYDMLERAIKLQSVLTWQFKIKNLEIEK